MTCSFTSRHTSSRTISKRLGGCWREEEADSNYSQHNGAAQYFHRIAAHADVGNALAFPGCSDIHFTWTTALDSLANQHVLIGLCDAVLDHPTGSATGRRACGRICRRKKTFALELQGGLRPVWDIENKRSWRRYSSEVRLPARN